MVLFFFSVLVSVVSGVSEESMCHFFLLFFLISFLKKFIFCHFCYKSCCRFLFVSVLFFFAYFLKNDVLPFLLEELLLIFCNNMIHIAELKNKCSFFIYFFPVLFV